MPNMLEDGFIDSAIFMHQVALLPGNADYALCNATQTAIGNASCSGLLTITVATAAYSNALVQSLIQRLVNMGYTASLSGTTLTVNW